MKFVSIRLDGQVALVTGGSRGIGRAVSLRLAQLGCHLAVNYQQNEAAANAVVAQAETLGVKAVALKADVADVEACGAMVQEAAARFGRLDILVCNAGIWQGLPVEEISEELWDKTLDINLKGTWAVCRAAVPVMKQQGSGRILIVSSTAGQRGEANVSNYAASKGGQISLTKSLASELAPFGITVNCVAPGWVDTELNNEVFADESRRRSIEATIPLGRIASAEEIADPIVFLCTDWARHITGEVLNVNGGSVLCG